MTNSFAKLAKNIYLVGLHFLLLVLILGGIYWRILISNISMGIVFLIFIAINFLYVPWLWSFLLKFPGTRKLILREDENLISSSKIKQFSAIALWYALPQFVLSFIFWFLVINIFFKTAAFQPILYSNFLRITSIIIIVTLIMALIFQRAPSIPPGLRLRIIVQFTTIYLGTLFAYILGQWILILNFTPHSAQYLIQFWLMVTTVILSTFALIPLQEKSYTLLWRVFLGLIASIGLIYLYGPSISNTHSYIGYQPEKHSPSTPTKKTDTEETMFGSQQ